MRHTTKRTLVRAPGIFVMKAGKTEREKERDKHYLSIFALPEKGDMRPFDVD